MRESIRTPIAHRDLCFLRQKGNKKHGMHKPSIHEQDLPVFAKLMGNVSKRRNILNASIQKQMHRYGESSCSSSTKAGIHLGPNYLIYKNTNFEEIFSLFNITEKLVMEHSEEILTVKCLEYSSPFWARSALSHDQAIKWAEAKVCVCADSVLYVGQMREGLEAIERWRGQVEGLGLCSSYQDAVGIGGEAIELEWKHVPGFSSLSILQEIQKDLA